VTLALADIIDAACSHAQTAGWFDTVNGHEPKRAPGLGVSASVWAQSLRPVSARSGLNATSALVVLNVRCMTPMLAEPQDDVDPNLFGAVDALMRAYTGDFDLGGLVSNVDLLGSYGPGLTAEAGYLNQDQVLYRVVTITLPLVVNDLWSQAA
jgi:hypothetical protein